jgi:erythromycin esterase-like protein
MGMRRLVIGLPLLFALTLAISISLSGRQTSSTVAPEIHPIDSKNYTDPNQFAFLSNTLKGVEVVSLGESIHMTHEFPLVRLGIIRYLNENMGFQVLAMEGSTEDIWVAQDRFLNSARTLDDAKDAQSGLFMLWNTPEVRQVFEYESASWTSANPLYLTAYDVQPGTGHGSQGADVFRQLAERLKTYAPAPNGLDLSQWMSDISRLVDNCDHFQSSDQLRADKAIQDLQRWIEIAAPEAQKRFPQVPHAIAMSLIPENLRARRQLCTDWSADAQHDYGAHRDPIAAQYTLELRAAIPGQKVMLWAHINHLFHDAEHYHVSTGEILRRALGTRLYTVGAFPEGGGAIPIFVGRNGENEDTGYTRVHSDQGALAERLSRLSSRDYFLDFRQTGIAAGSDPAFVSPQLIWFEEQNVPLAIARDFDGIIWIKKIHAPDWPLVLLMMFSGRHYISELIGVGFLLICGIVFLIIRGIQRRKRTE